MLDEAQAIKNPSSRRAKSAKRLNARFRAAATGTPVENNLTELWSLFDFINPGLLGTQGHFEHKFVSKEGPPMPALKLLVSPFILRRLKSKVLDYLPPKTEITLSVTLEEKVERQFYELLRRNAWEDLSSGGDVSRNAICAHLTTLRRACCHPSLVAPKAKMPGAKMELLMELVDELRAGGHRALVYSQFVDCLTIIRERLDAQGISYQYFDGTIPERERIDQIDGFQAGKADFFLISTESGRGRDKPDRRGLRDHFRALVEPGT